MEAKEHRDQILSKLNSYFDVVLENIEQQPRSGERDALAALVSCFNATVEIMQTAKNDEAFMTASKFYGDLVDKEFFNKIYNSNPPKEEEKEEVASAPRDEEFNIKAHVLEDPSDLPLELRKQLAEALKSLGLPESEIKKNLNL